MKKKKSVRKEIIEWAIFLGIIAILYGTGLHTPVLGFMQGLILKTGIMQPSLESEESVNADYDFALINEEGERIPFSQSGCR